MSDEARSGAGDLPGEELPAEEAARRQRVAATLQRVQAGVRQRRAELATVGGGREDTRLRLAELKSLEWVEEPTPVSPRPGVGRLLVFVRKAFFHLFHKWYARPVLHQQNGFNRAAAELLAELARRLTDAEAQVARLTARLRELEGSEEPDGDEGGAESGEEAREER
jgi:hypothetical protein